MVNYKPALLVIVRPALKAWGLAPGYEALPGAQLVVVNARTEDERSRGEALLEEIARIRKDRSIYNDLIGVPWRWHGSRRFGMLRPAWRACEQGSEDFTGLLEEVVRTRMGTGGGSASVPGRPLFLRQASLVLAGSPRAFPQRTGIDPSRREMTRSKLNELLNIEFSLAARPGAAPSG